MTERPPLPAPRLPLLAEPWPAGVHKATCPVCGGYWQPFAFSRLPCHAACLFDDAAVAQLDALASSGAYRSQQDLADALGVTTSVLRATLARGQWRRHDPG